MPAAQYLHIIANDRWKLLNFGRLVACDLIDLLLYRLTEAHRKLLLETVRPLPITQNFHTVEI